MRALPLGGGCRWWRSPRSTSSTAHAAPATLTDLFDGRSQLLVYHLMPGPGDEEGCPSCSFWLDNAGNLSRFHARDTSFVTISRAPLEK